MREQLRPYRMVDKKFKEKLIKKYQTHEGDTGSPQVQIAILTEETRFLVEHLKEHKKDFSSRRGLLKKVSERRRLLKYLGRETPEAHDDLVKKLHLKTKSAVETAGEVRGPLIGATKRRMNLAIQPQAAATKHVESASDEHA